MGVEPGAPIFFLSLEWVSLVAYWWHIGGILLGSDIVGKGGLSRMCLIQALVAKGLGKVTLSPVGCWYGDWQSA